MSESATTVYDVRMQTSIGIRTGRIMITQCKDKINGYLDILNHREPFEGMIDEDGNCSLTGKIITLVRTIQYQAIGKILPKELELSIQDGHHTLRITGTPAHKEM